MKYCKFCGHVLDDDALYCSACGCKVEEGTSSTYQHTKYAQVNDYSNYEGDQGNPCQEPYGALAIITLICAFLAPIVGFILGIIGLLTDKSKKNRAFYLVGIFLPLVLIAGILLIIFLVAIL